MTATAEPSHHANARLWTVGAIVALVLHASVAAMALAAGLAADRDDSAGATAMDIGLESEAPSSDSSAVEASADETAQAMVAVANSARTGAQFETEPTPPRDEAQAERVMAEDRQPADRQRPPEPRQESVTAAAPAATAAPSRLAEHDGAQSRARSIGSEAVAERRRAAWRQGLVAHLERHKRPPTTDRQAAADVVVGFSIDRTGRVLSVEIVKGSGDRRYDEAALAMVRRADPVPLPPDDLGGRGLSFRLPVSFRNGG